MTARSLLLALALLVSACAPTLPPALTQKEVQDFVQQYVAAYNAGDDSKLLGMIQRDPGVSSVASGRLYRGWDAIRTASEETLSAVARIVVKVGAIEVTPLGTDSALAVAPIVVAVERFSMPVSNTLTSVDFPGALSLIVKRTPEGLRIVHEHHSVRAQ